MSADNAIFILETLCSSADPNDRKYFVLHMGYTQIYESIIQPLELGEIDKAIQGIQNQFVQKARAFDGLETAKTFAEILLNSLDICEYGIIQLSFLTDVGVGKNEVFPLNVQQIHFYNGEFQLTPVAQSLGIDIRTICWRIDDGQYRIRRNIDDPGYCHGDYLVEDTKGRILAFCVELAPTVTAPQYMAKLR